METQVTDEVRAAVLDLQRYLLDKIPPLTAADAIETLRAQPPQVLMKQMYAWAAEQSRIHDASMGEVLFNGLRKIYRVSALRLVDGEALDAYLAGVYPIALQLCPAEQREALRAKIATLPELAAEEPVIRESAPAPVVVPDDEISRNARRLARVVSRLESEAAALTPAARAQLAALVVAASRTDHELSAFVENLRTLLGAADADSLAAVLAQGIPSWNVDVPSARPSAIVEAMGRLVAISSRELDTIERTRALLRTAVAQFNRGGLSSAVAMLDLVQRVEDDEKIDPGAADRMRTEAMETLAADALKRYAEDSNSHVLLRKVLCFFPSLTKESLLHEIRVEPRAERRRAILGMLEAHGAPARADALAQLEVELDRPRDQLESYYIRNLLFLLHRIPRDSYVGVEKEIELLGRALATGQNILVVREAVLPLGMIRSQASVDLLLARMGELESALLHKDTSLYFTEEMQKLLDRVTGALARIATPAALVAVARHGLKPNALLGDARARLAPLAQHDLSFDPQMVSQMIAAIRDELPTRILGKVVKTQAPPLRLIQALGGTRTPAVTQLLEEIVDKFPELDVGRVAQAALAGTGAKSAAREGTALPSSGDLPTFGVPALLRTLHDAEATGLLTLPNAKLLVLNGRFVDAQTASLRGIDALYQLLERPAAGTFVFASQPAPATKPRNELLDVRPLIAEGVRRHEELNRLSLLVPDDLPLKPTSQKPTPDPEESDPAIVREVWVNAASGRSVSEWEPRIPTDAYRVRRLLWRWVEEGALVGM